MGGRFAREIAAYAGAAILTSGTARELLARKVRAGADQAIVELVEILALPRRTAGPRRTLVVAPGEVAVDGATGEPGVGTDPVAIARRLGAVRSHAPASDAAVLSRIASMAAGAAYARHADAWSGLLGTADLGGHIAAGLAGKPLQVANLTGIAAVGVAATDPLLRQVDAGEFIVDDAAIEPTFTDASIWPACARFEAHVACVGKAAFLPLATPLETETVDTGGATDTGAFGRTGVRAEVLVDANVARSGLAASPAIAAVGKGTAFAGDTDTGSGLLGAADLGRLIAARLADIGCRITHMARVAAIGVGAAGAFN